MNEEMIGYCGYNCHLCAARSDDPDVRQKLVEGWKKIFGHQHYTSENVHCGGCRSNGKIADKECNARHCAIDRGIDNCALCNDFVCKKVSHLLANREGMIVFLHSKSFNATKEEYNLCMRQFESMPNIIKILVDSGKIPSWTLQDEQ